MSDRALQPHLLLHHLRWSGEVGGGVWGGFIKESRGRKAVGL